MQPGTNSVDEIINRDIAQKAKHICLFIMAGAYLSVWYINTTLGVSAMGWVYAMSAFVYVAASVMAKPKSGVKNAVGIVAVILVSFILIPLIILRYIGVSDMPLLTF